MDWLEKGGKAIRGEKYPTHYSIEMREKYNPEGFFESNEMMGCTKDLGDVAVKILIPYLINHSQIPEDAKIIWARRELFALVKSQIAAEEITGAYGEENTLAYNQLWYSKMEDWIQKRNVLIVEFEDLIKNPEEIRQVVLDFITEVK
jgi:hypothetical protein